MSLPWHCPVAPQEWHQMLCGTSAIRPLALDIRIQPGAGQSPAVTLAVCPPVTYHVLVSCLCRSLLSAEVDLLAFQRTEYMTPSKFLGFCGMCWNMNFWQNLVKWGKCDILLSRMQHLFGITPSFPCIVAVHTVFWKQTWKLGATPKNRDCFRNVGRIWWNDWVMVRKKQILACRQ